MMRHSYRAPLRFPRTASEAFRDARYGAAIERPLPPLWKRLIEAVREILS